MARRSVLNSLKFILLIAVILCASLCSKATAADSYLQSAGPISVGYVGLYYGLVNPANGNWYVGEDFFGG